MFSRGMMIRPDNHELEAAISIALKAAPSSAIRNVMTPTGKLNREVAIETLTARVVAALKRYEMTREPTALEMGVGTLPLFPESSG